ncbi:hypothetical protein FG93_05509 [Bosea sp. LC85]|uniref:hypothetical protein n=1 Tax=Bosea sp. LC85 TaxID=1502851 RepID=UPI0004E42CD0|nr:hypothetical protein [Bosea sp. LC85]KFC63999.1 hypothetical protein FG93_05509 [Bosea sp. LC85]
MQPGSFKPGSLSDRVLRIIQAAGGANLHQVQIRRACQDEAEHKYLGRILDRLVVRGLVNESRQGFSAIAGPRPYVCERDPAPAVSEMLSLHVRAIIARAHVRAADGESAFAAGLLRLASRRVRVPHVEADLLALADLFGSDDGFYRNLDLSRVAA